MPLVPGLYDAATAITPGQKIEADICIIGSGAAGLVIAHALKDMKGKHDPAIVVLEGGAAPAASGLGEYFRQPFYMGTFTSDSATPARTFLQDSRVRAYGGQRARYHGHAHEKHGPYPCQATRVREDLWRRRGVLKAREARDQCFASGRQCVPEEPGKAQVHPKRWQEEQR